MRAGSGGSAWCRGAVAYLHFLRATTCMACGSVMEAPRVFQKVSKPEVMLWNVQIGGCVRDGRCEEALALFHQMRREGIRPDHFTFPTVLKACARLCAVEQGKHIHRCILTHGPHSHLFIHNALIHMYVKCMHFDMARQVFDKMPQRNVITWNGMIAGYAQSGQVEEALYLFYEMQRAGTNPNPVTVVNVLPACAHHQRLQQGKEIHSFVIRNGFEWEVFVGNAVVDMYAKCGNVEDACRAFWRMPQMDVVSWNAMITGFAQNGCWVDALKLFRKMQMAAVKPNPFTFVSVLPACGHLGGVQQGKEAHAYLLKHGFQSHVFVGAAILDMYAKCRNTEDAQRVFYRMAQRDVVSWNAMIVGCAHNGHPAKALTLFHQMELHGVKPNSGTIASVLPACARLASLRQGKEIHGHLIKNAFDSRIIVGNALIDMYAKCGIVTAAHRVFEKMSQRTVVSWNAIIAGYGMHGHADDALELFYQMRQAGTKPDHITLVAVLSACSHSGMVDEGWHYFDCMSRDYQIAPRMEHYACMVDLLGRAGQLSEAHDVISNMPFEPDASVWGALLGACRIHCNIELGEQVANRLFELEPENAGFYVLLSNIYAVAGRWADVAKVRTMLKDRGLRKTPGCSWI